jgi:tetratricopeptide (TPR) repeat protein
MNKGQLREWAGTTTFDRGERLAKLGHVYDYIQAPDRVQAKVQGEDLYDVELIQPDNHEQAKATCTCPASGYQPICKHAIATYLVYLGEYNESRYALEEPTIELPSYKATLNWVNTLDRDALLEIVQSQLQDNPALRESLAYRCFIEQQHNHFTPQQVTELIDEALPLEWAWGFEEASAYFDNVQNKLDALNHALRGLPAKACYQLAWYAIVRLNTVSIEYVDTSYGEQYTAYQLFLEMLFSALGQSDESTQEKLKFITKALNTPIDINDTADFLHCLEKYATSLSQTIRQRLKDDEEDNLDFTAASTLMHHYRQQAEKEENWQEAINWLLRVELNDSHWLTMGHYHLHLKQYKQAARCLNQARKLMDKEHFHYAKSIDLECAIAEAEQDIARMWEIRWDQFQNKPSRFTIGHLSDL